MERRVRTERRERAGDRRILSHSRAWRRWVAQTPSQKMETVEAMTALS